MPNAMNASGGGSEWWRPYDDIDHVSVVYVDLSKDLQTDTRALGWLDEEERTRAQRLKVARARTAFVRCRAALRANLCNRIGCQNPDLTFVASEGGKPAALVQGERLDYEFNVSHSFDHGLLAFAREGRLGVDVEDRNRRRDVSREIRKVFSEEEQQLLLSASGKELVELFFRLWTVKEALIKATGDGFRLKTSLFSAPDSLLQGQRKASFRFGHLPQVEWTLVNLECDKFAGAFAHEVMS